MYVGPSAFHDIASFLLGEVYDALPVQNQPNRSCMMPGGIVWDECECGLLVAYVSRIYLSDTFPLEASVSSCATGWLVGDLIFQLVRCTPVMNDSGMAPSCEALNESSLQVTQDAWYLTNTVACELDQLRDSDDIVDYLVRSTQIQGATGGCVGSELIVTVAIERREA